LALWGRPEAHELGSLIEIGEFRRSPSARAGNSPAWSPDGLKVAFTWGIFVMNPDGSEHERLTLRPKGLYRSDSLTWSPDGRKLAFVAGNEDTCDFCFDLYVMNADGSGQRRLTHGGLAFDPAWSPDGRKIAFSGGAQGIFVMNADGSGERRLTRNFCGRQRSCLVARRAEDRLRQQPRRQL